MSTFLDLPHQAIPYFEPVKGNNAKKNFKERNVEQSVAGRFSHMLQAIFGLKKNLPSDRGHSVFKFAFIQLAPVQSIPAY